MKRKSIVIFSATLLLALVLGVGYTKAANLPATGGNPVAVTSCQDVAGGVQIVHPSGPTWTLLNGTKDAGHGVKQYTYWCTSSTQYYVTWKPVPQNPLPAPDMCQNVTGENGTYTLCKNGQFFHSASGMSFKVRGFIGNKLGLVFTDASPKHILLTQSVQTTNVYTVTSNNSMYRFHLAYHGKDAFGRAMIHVTTEHMNQPDTHAPTAWMNVQSKQDVGNGYQYTLNLGSYDTSPIQKMILSGGLASDFPSLPHAKTWEYTANINAVQENFTLPYILQYGKTYRFQVAGWDKAGNASTVSVVTIEVPAATTDTQNPVITTQMTRKFVQTAAKDIVVAKYSAKATDNSNQLGQIAIYYSPTNTANTFTVVKTCSSLAPNTWCTYEGAGNQNYGYYYAKVWDTTGNQVTSETANFFIM